MGGKRLAWGLQPSMKRAPVERRTKRGMHFGGGFERLRKTGGERGNRKRGSGQAGKAAGGYFSSPLFASCSAGPRLCLSRSPVQDHEGVGTFSGCGTGPFAGSRPLTDAVLEEGNKSCASITLTHKPLLRPAADGFSSRTAARDGGAYR